MNKLKKIAFTVISVVLVIALSSGLLYALGSDTDPTVIFDASSKTFSFQNVKYGADQHDGPTEDDPYPDLFAIRGAMPGDSFSWDVNVRVTNAANKIVKMYVHAENANEDFSPLFDTANPYPPTMTVTFPDGTDYTARLNDTTPVLIGEYNGNGTQTINLSLSINILAGNEIAGLDSEIDWVFYAQVQDVTPPTPTSPPEPETVDVSVEKVWVDEGDHPASVTVHLLANAEDTGMSAELSDANGWYYVWTGLDKYDSDRVRISYIVQEDVPEGYVATYTGSVATGFVITNTYDDEITDDDLPLYGPALNTVDHFGYIIGVPGGYVRPEDNITRAETATILFRLLTDESRAEYWSTTNSFSDVSSGDWYNNAISTLERAGIVKGRPDGTFGPTEPITRAEYAVMFARFFEVVPSARDLFPDIAGHWAREYINSAAQYGFINGRPDGTFGPDDYILRCEAFTLTNRVLGRKPDKDHLHEDMVVWKDNTPDKWYYAQVQEATNSHEYNMLDEDTDAPYEEWTSIQPMRDWAALEKEWATVNVNDPNVYSSKP